MADRMTVKALRELLAKFNDNDEVKLWGPTSDCWVTVGDWENDNESTILEA